MTLTSRVATGRVEQVRAATGHAGAEVRSHRAEDDDGATGHVLAAVRTDALDDGGRPGVADREAHPGATDEVQSATGGAVQAGVAGDGLARGSHRQIGLRRDRDAAAGQPFAHVVVGLAHQAQGDTRPGEGTERLAGRPVQLEADRTAQLAALEGAGQTRAERAVRRRDAQTAGTHRTLVAERRGDPCLER
jgi:hypothetical protein